MNRPGADGAPGALTSWPAGPDGALSELQMESLLCEAIQREPTWRDRAAECAAFHDSDQVDAATRRELEKSNLSDFEVNLINPAVRAVIGNAEQLQTLPRIAPRHKRDYASARALQSAFALSMEQTAFMARAEDAFESCVKVGIGWLHVSRSMDPRRHPYRVESPSWRDVYWDWRSRHIDQGRYIVRRSWQDRDTVLAAFPRRAEVIDRVWSGEWEFPESDGGLSGAAGTSESLNEMEWRDRAERERLALFEIWYKVTVPDLVTVTSADGETRPFDPRSRWQLEGIARDLLALRRGPSSALRQAFYLGRFRLADVPRPDHADFPLFAARFAARDDNAMPYGLVSLMMGSQDMHNHVLRVVIANAVSRRILIDPGVLHNMTLQEFADEWSKPNAIAPVDLSKVGGDVRRAFHVASDNERQSAQLWPLLMQAPGYAREASGIHAAYQGQGAASQSGTALHQLAAQTSAMVQRPMTLYKRSRRAAAALLAAFLHGDLSRMRDIRVDVDGVEGGEVILNERRDGRLLNPVAAMRFEVEIEERAKSPSERQHEQVQLMELFKAADNPAHREALMRLFAENSDMRDRDAFLEALGDPPKDPARRQAFERSKAEQEEFERQMRAVALRKAVAEAMLKEAQAAASMARADKTAGADTELAQAQAVGELAEVERLDRDQQARQVDIEAGLIEKEVRVARGA